MAQAKRKKPASKSSKGSHGLGMFLSGLVTGAVAMAFFQGWNSDDPSSIGRGLAHMIESSKQSAPKTEANGTASSPEAVSTSLDFYTMLPEIETFLPEHESIPQAPEVTKPAMSDTDETDRQTGQQKPPKEAKLAARYELQAGAFARIADADRLQARLALSGLESRIQKVTIQNRGDFYRVRLGPYETSSALTQATGTLNGMGIKPLRFKLSP